MDQIRVHRWQSIEDPTWVEVKIRVKVTGETETALRFFETAVAVFEELIEPERERLIETMNPEIDWTDPSWT